MTTGSRIRTLVAPLATGLAILVGLWVLYHYSQSAFGGPDKVWLFEKRPWHRYTAMSLLTGTLKLSPGLSKAWPDLQAFNGATYTNWGFGVPLMQIPFHLAAARLRSMPQKFFPDRAIYFAYLMALIPVLWAAFYRLLETRNRAASARLRRLFLSWAATTLVLATVLWPLMSTRFLVYEETCCYFAIVELAALAAYVFAQRAWSSWAVAALGAAAGMGLLVRPTGLLYLGMWAVLIVVEQRTRRTLLTFAAAAAPFVACWMLTNWVRNGSLFGLGYDNAMPWFDYHTPVVRFGSQCANTPGHLWVVIKRLFTAFFFVVNDDPKPWPWLARCHFSFETPPPWGGAPMHEPFLGVAVLVVLAWMVLHQLSRRDFRVAFYAPVGVLVVLFGTYVWAAAGFAWRYTADFWPAVVLAIAQYVRFLPRKEDRWLGAPLGLALLASAWSTFARDVDPGVPNLEVTDQAEVDTMWADFTRFRWAQDKIIPSLVKCGDHVDWLFHDGQGWKDHCNVDTFTNLFVGVPNKAGDSYHLTFKTEGFDAPTLRVYLNGRIYSARRSGDQYVADVSIRYARLTSPIVMATIEWTRDFDPPAGKLLSVQLT